MLPISALKKCWENYQLKITATSPNGKWFKLCIYLYGSSGDLVVPFQVQGTVVDAHELLTHPEKVLLEKETMAVIQFHHEETEWILHEMEEIDLLARGKISKSPRTFYANLGLTCISHRGPVNCNEILKNINPDTSEVSFKKALKQCILLKCL